MDVDLFEHTETLPLEVQAILNKYCDGDNTYEKCAELVAELETVGYTCEYGLDAEPFNLQRIKISEEDVDKVFEFAYIALAALLNGEFTVEEMRKVYFEQKLANEK